MERLSRGSWGQPGPLAASELAQVLEERGALDGTNALRVAVWRMRSGTTAAAAMLITAARESNRVFDHDLAARLASEALGARTSTTCSSGAPAQDV